MASCTHHVKTRIAHATVALKPRSSAQLHQLAVWEWNHRVVQGLTQTNDTHVQPGSPHIRCTPYVLLQALRCAHRCLSLAWPDAACKKVARALIAATCHAHPNSRTMHIAPHHCRWAHLQRTRKHKRETKGSFKCQANAHRTSSVLAPFATSLGFLRHRAVFGEMTLALRHITIAHARSLHHIASRPALQLKHFNFSSFGCFIGGSCTAGQSGLRFPGNGGSGTVLTGPPPAATAPPAAPAEPAASPTSFGGPNNRSCCCLARLGTHAEITGTQRATMQPHARQHNLVDLPGHDLDVEP